MTLSKPLTVLVDVVAWAVISAVTGLAVHRLRAERFDHDTWLTAERAVERGGRLYIRAFRVKRWKHLLPEAGDLFEGGFDKSSLRTRSLEHLGRHLVETRRAEVGHWAAMAAGPLFFLWNPWYAGVVIQLYAIAANGPCIVSQRYNRIRLRRILARVD